MTSYVNIGTNLGDRRSNLERAVAELERRLGPARRAPLEESEPWGFASANRFLNLGLAFETGDMDPHRVLDLLQEAERAVDASAHRDERGRYIDRVIDIDLVAVDRLHIDSPRLRLPHPRLHERPFFWRPYLFLLEGKAENTAR